MHAPEVYAMFRLGQIVATPGALDALEHNLQTPFEFLQRHLIHDWGYLSEEDKRENDESVLHGFRILSAYRLKDSTRIWIITEADRSSTTILLPSEY